MALWIVGQNLKNKFEIYFVIVSIPKAPISIIFELTLQSKKYFPIIWIKYLKASAHQQAELAKFLRCMSETLSKDDYWNHKHLWSNPDLDTASFYNPGKVT